MGLKWKTQIAGVLVVASLFSIAPSLAFAEKDCHAKMAEELGLSADQKQKLNQVRGEFHKTLPDKKKAMKVAREELQATLRGSATADEARQKFQELQKREDEFAQARFEKILAIRALLTPEQRQKFKGLEHRGKGGCHEKGGDQDGNE